MKIIFLDLDGVLTTLSTKWQTFHPDCVKALKRVLDATGANIVLSSCWRHGFIDWRTENNCLVHHTQALPVLKEMFIECGLPADTLISKTPDILNSNATRGEEISLWLKKHGEEFGVQQFIVLDDSSDVEPHFEHFVQTDGELGMNEKDADKAISLLT